MALANTALACASLPGLESSSLLCGSSTHSKVKKYHNWASTALLLSLFSLDAFS